MIRAYTRRYADLKVLYDLDFPDHQTILRQRTYKTSDGAIETPITGLLQARVVSSDCPAPRARPFTPRRLVACFANPSNVTGQSELSVMSPYRPTDTDLVAHAREVRAYPEVLGVSYFGESHSTSVEPYV